jgi:hypothetical protein
MLCSSLAVSLDSGNSAVASRHGQKQPSAFQAFGNLCSARLNPRVTKFGEFPRVTLSVNNGWYNQLSGHPT